MSEDLDQLAAAAVALGGLIIVVECTVALVASTEALAIFTVGAAVVEAIVGAVICRVRSLEQVVTEAQPQQVQLVVWPTPVDPAGTEAPPAVERRAAMRPAPRVNHLFIGY